MGGDGSDHPYASQLAAVARTLRLRPSGLTITNFDSTSRLFVKKAIHLPRGDQVGQLP